VLQALPDEALEEDDELCAEVAALVNIAGCQLLEAWKLLDQPKSEEALAAVLGLMPQLQRFLLHKDNEISEEVFDFAGVYIESLNEKRKSVIPEGEALTPAAAASRGELVSASWPGRSEHAPVGEVESGVHAVHLEALLKAFLQKAEYPEAMIRAIFNAVVTPF